MWPLRVRAIKMTGSEPAYLDEQLLKTLFLIVADGRPNIKTPGGS